MEVINECQELLQTKVKFRVGNKRDGDPDILIADNKKSVNRGKDIAKDTILTPNFYTTDFEAMEKMDAQLSQIFKQLSGKKSQVQLKKEKKGWSERKYLLD